MKAIFLFAALFCINSRHAFHLSVTEVNYNHKTKAYEVSCRMFWDDLEVALQRSNPHYPIDILNPKDPNKLDSIVFGYLDQRLKIKLNGTEIKPNPISTKIKDDVLTGYLEIPSSKTPHHAEVHNTLFTELFSDQMNLVHFKVFEQTKSLKFDAKSPTGYIIF